MMTVLSSVRQTVNNESEALCEFSRPQCTRAAELGLLPHLNLTCQSARV